MTESIQPRWVRVGYSESGAAYEAGASAARAACDDPRPKLLLVFASFASYGDTLRELVEGVADVAGDIPVIGCTTSGEIGPGDVSSGGVVAVGFGGDFEISTAYAGGLSEQPRAVGEAIASALLPLPDRRHNIVLMLTDTLAGDQQEVIRGAYGVFGATVQLVGGGAGDDMRMVTSWQIFGGKILQDAVVAASISSDGPLGLSLRHGWHSEGEPMMATASSSNTVYALNDRPALDVYLDAHHAPAGIDTDPSAFATFALTRPLAVARRGDVAVRHVLGADLDGRGLRCAGGVSRGASVWLASGDPDSLLTAADQACEDAVRALDGHPLVALLIFDCAGRRAVLGADGLHTERQLMREHAGNAPLVGFYSYGEIARLRGANGFHNQAFIAVAIG